MSKHQIYGPEFKARVVLEVLQGPKTRSQVCTENKLAPSLHTYWTKRFIERSPQLFAIKPQRQNIEKQIHMTEIERLISELNLELTALKNSKGIY